MPSAAASTRPLTWTSSSRGRLAGSTTPATLTIQLAASTPIVPPASAMTPLSTICCLKMCARVAPRAARTANSRRRRCPRESRRLATFAHAISSTQPTAPNATSNGRLMSPTTASWSGTTVTLQPLFVSECSRSSRDATARSESRARSTVAPARQTADHAQIVRRPRQLAARRRHRQPDVCVPRRKRERCRHHAHNRARRIVDHDRLARRRGGRAELAAAKASLTMATTGWAGAASSDKNARPNAGGISSTANKSGVTVEPADAGAQPRAALSRRACVNASQRVNLMLMRRITHVEVVGRRNGVAENAARIRRPHPYERRRVRIRQPPEDDRVDDAEGRDVGADADRRRQDRGGRESPAAPAHSSRPAVRRRQSRRIGARCARSRTRVRSRRCICHAAGTDMTT